MFTPEDLHQIRQRGQTPEAIELQLENFRQGFPFLNVIRAASPGDGVEVIAEAEAAAAVERYEKAVAAMAIVKFVPASGAATRMFKELFEFVNEGKRGRGIDTLLGNIEKFAFWPELKASLPDGADDRTIVDTIVNTGLGYGQKPKGLVTFHAYPEGARKAVEEHLVEGAVYAASNGVAKIHFTVSPEHIEGFEELLEEKVPAYEKRFGIRYDISFSVQKPSTDTIAVNPDNTPFRQDDGTLLFRPAGHGALIENLNEIDADVVFIKNIDNVTTDAQRGDTIRYKKVLAGILLDLQDRAFEYLKALEVGGAELDPITEFIEKRLCVKLPDNYDSSLLRAVLDRPIRVCGMVRNEGEPGGGPFWTGNPDGTQSLQIAESSQIAPGDLELMKSATHFNPVDLVCGVKDSRGRKFDLRKYTDPATGFISSKSSGGRELRAQELPGLWNGAMARWNTVFVDVPISTFSPVKVAQDLLRPQHQ
ncbi:DUF4301 family protein [uncultured Alistipes sp.]|jgi:hypothetical protein|uniref:DUF4301 family protein n=1 Tax=uncultured Alistipes sp. TaxID=538949 RepID=UPI0025F63685|nr:DUF4301 family protein [uncultured Alistipes sp.]